MAYAKSTAACDSRLKAMEVGDSLNPSYPVPPYSSLLYRSEHISVKFSDMECRISPYLKETPTAMATLTTTTLPCMPNKIGEKPGASDGRHLRTIPPTFEKLEMQFSEACQKSFIVFDHSASLRRIIVHPALLNDHSAFLPNTSKDIGDFSGHLQDISDRAVETMLSTPCQADPSTWHARLLAYRETMDLAFAALQRMRAEGFCSSGSMGGDGLVAFPNTAEEAESTSRKSENEVYQDHSGGTQSILHEDTEDLEALLSSDDEVSSTGHSPSEGSSNNIPTLSGDNKNNSSTVSSKKRRNNPEEDAEADSCSSEADSGWVLVSDCQFNSPNVSHPAIESWEPLTHRNNVVDPKCRESFGLGGSMMSIPKQASSRNSGTKYNHTRRSSEKGGLVKRSRKSKIKKTVQLLRNIIPGGDCMDTAAVLDEAIQYVKSMQVKVQKLEAKKFI